MKGLLLLTLSLSCSAYAQSGADELLDSLGEKPVVKSKAGLPTATVNRRDYVGDVFQQQLAVNVQSHRDLSFDIKQWAQLVLESEFTKASHLWTAIQVQIPEDFRDQAEATNLYLLWKVGLHQTFFDQWVKALANPTFAQSTPELTLESLLTPGLDAWLLKSAILINPKQQTILDSLQSTKPFVTTLKAWNGLRRAQQAEEILSQLSPENKLTRYVAQTAVYNHIKSGDLKGAAKILRDSVEPAIEVSQDPELLAKHDLSIARILYQAGQMKAAGQYYVKIPNKSPSYLPAREELSWVYLRLADMSKLRGEIKALSNPVFKDRFQPEVYLLRAVSNLKMCFYDLLDKDLMDFSQSNGIWAKKIDQALTSKVPPAPDHLDEYTQMSLKVTKSMEGEMKRLTELGEQSIGAVLPAVGQQQHWKDHFQQGQASLEVARKRLNDDYTRQWKNQRAILQEAIRKMRFVKVEYLSQVRQLSGGGEIDPKKFVASNSSSAPAASVVKSETDQLNFPASTEVWPDELFKLRSAAQAQCLKKANAK